MSVTPQEFTALNALGEQMRRHPTPPDDLVRVKPLAADDLHLRIACETNQTLEGECNWDRERARQAVIRSQATIMQVASEIGLSITDRDYLAGYLVDMADEFDTAVIDYHGMERA